MRLINPRASDTILDIGGYPAYWTGQNLLVKAIDVVNLLPMRWCGQGFPFDRIRTFVADGCALPLPDGGYDVAYSNSTIEHVGSWERQKQFAAELRRVGKALWLQTPAFECPIEPHYVGLGIHYLTPWLQRRLIRWSTLWGLLERPSADEIDRAVRQTRLLRKSEMRLLFPDCEIRTERILWVIPKSHIAVRRRQLG